MRGAREPVRRRRPTVRLARTVLLTLVSCVAATFVVTPHVSIAGATLVPDPTAAVDGRVDVLVTVGQRVVLGGDFDDVGGAARANVAALLPDGAVDDRFAPVLDGPVTAAAASPDHSTVFLAGSFTSVDGTPRDGVAAVDSTTGQLLRRWRSEAPGPVAALAVLDRTLLLGGEDGVSAVRLADGFPAGLRIPTDGPVTDLVVAQGRIHLGGAFETVAGRHRTGVAVSFADGRLTSFSPDAVEAPVEALALAPDGERLFVADGSRVQAFLPTRSELPTWTLTTDGDVRALAAGPHTLFIGGSFRQLAGATDSPAALASVDPLTGVPSSWGLPVTGGDGPEALLLTSQGLVAGGAFDAAGGHLRANLLRLPTSRSGAVVSAGRDLRLRDDALVTLSGSVRVPAGAGPAEAEWRQMAGAPVELIPAGDATATFRPNPGRDTLAFELVVTDVRGRQWQDAVTVDIVATPTVAVIGDSLTARVDGRRDPPTREATTRALLVEAGWDPGSVFWWARGGKTLTTPDRSGHTTFEDIHAATAALGGPVDLVYVGLGTNDSSATEEQFGERLAAVLDALDAYGAGDVVWMGLGFRAPDDPRAARLNPVLTEQVGDRGWSVVDFAGHLHDPEVFDPQDWIYSVDPTDRVHLTAQGYAKRDALAVEALVAARER